MAEVPNSTSATNIDLILVNHILESAVAVSNTENSSDYYSPITSRHFHCPRKNGVIPLQSIHELPMKITENQARQLIDDNGNFD
jgi:hypothetical protein